MKRLPILLALAAFPAAAAEPPPSLEALHEARPARELATEFAEEKRRAAMRAAALSFGSRAGLARRTWEIGRMLERFAPALDGVYRFRRLLLRREGFLLLPPVLAETADAFRMARDGARAASARRVIRILAPARIVSAPPSWRDYLIRSWRPAEPPVSVLFPRDAAETEEWRRRLAEGWTAGRALADDVFAADLDRLNRDFEGIALWRRLHAARMVTAPSLEASRAGVAGHGRLMRIGETAAALGAPARLEIDAARWRPAVEEEKND